MTQTRRAQRLAAIAAGKVMCECQTHLATHLCASNEPECDVCERLNKQALHWHQRTREAMTMLLPYEERVAIEDERAEKQRQRWRHYNHYVRKNAERIRQIRPHANS
jgi:hypothetical protein